MTQWEVSGCPDAKARQPNGYFSPLACGVLPQPPGHGEQNTCDGEKRRAGKPADALRQDVEDDGEGDDRRGEQQRGQSEQEAWRKYFLARVTKQEQPIAFQNLVRISGGERYGYSRFNELKKLIGALSSGK
jgi:hypothetical protein